MKAIKWVNNHIEVEPPNKPKKISGTFFPTVLGFDPWKTPFEAWCKSTRTFEPPFEGNKYTNAGQIIEGKVFEFLRTSLGYGNRVVTPTDLYGEDYFKRTRGDFFPDDTIFSGMDDALIYDETMTYFEYVVEVKTVQVDGRSGTLEERWKDGKAPDYQALQASLYAHKRGIKKVLMVAVALEDKKGDYENPEQVVPSFANSNVYIDEFKVSERYPNFDIYIEKATNWWNNHVLTGISPEFDEKKDAEILKALRTNNAEIPSDISTLIKEAEQLKTEIAEITDKVSGKEKELKAITNEIKKFAMKQFRDGDTKVSIKGKEYEFVLAKSNSTEIDTESILSDMGEDFINKYTRQKISYRLTTSLIKED